MTPKVPSAIETLQKDGPVPLAKETSLFLARQTPLGRKLLYNRSWKDIRERMKQEEDLNDILDTVLEVEPGYYPYQIKVLQLRDEIEALATLVEREQPQSILEIGTAKGGSLYIWSRYLDSVNEIISLDLPGGQFGGGYDQKMTDIYQKFDPSKEMHFVRDDSHQESTFDEVSAYVDDGVDFLFIDGDHTYEGVKQDFEMYSQLVADDGIVAFHDIVHHPDDPAEVENRRRNVDGIEERHLSWDDSHPECNVDRFWEELVEEYETEEIISHEEQTWGGIGVVRL